MECLKLVLSKGPNGFQDECDRSRGGGIDGPLKIGWWASGLNYDADGKRG